MEHRRYGQVFPGQAVPATVFAQLTEVYCVVDAVPWEGKDLVKVFAELSSAQQWAKDHATDATGLYEVHTMNVDHT